MLTRVSAVQLPFTYFSTPQEFADLVRVQIEAAAEGRAELIVLPYLASLMLFGMFDFGAKASDSLEALAARHNVEVADWLENRAGYVQEFYMHLFQSLAERVEKWLAPGTVLEADGGSLYLTAYVLNPAGEIVGRQRQMNPTNEEKQWGVASEVLPSTDDFGKDMGVWHVSMTLPQVIAVPIAGVLLDYFNGVGAAPGSVGPTFGYTVIFALATFYFVMGTVLVRRIRKVR